jgi:hypothetical protein
MPTPNAVPMMAARLCLRWAGVSVSAGIAYDGCNRGIVTKDSNTVASIGSDP